MHGVFVAVQTGRHRDYFLPMTRHGEVIDEEHAAPPSSRAALISVVLLVLTAVVGVLTVVPGRATLLQAGIHLALFGAFLFLAISP